MKKVDLHVHTRYSAHPSEWFLQRIGTRESYSEPEEVYRTARAQGMDYVAVTDHNQIEGALRLKERYSDTVIVGDEVTTYFPEDGCKIHLLVWGLSVTQYREIETLRTDIYQLRDYVREQQLAHAVAHMTFSVNNKLTISHVERLILLFDCFEGINGSRNQRGNETVMTLLHELTPVVIESLQERYQIEPFGDTSWHKGFSGGSDDHSGLFVGRSYTVLEEGGETPEAFLEGIKEKKTLPRGRHNDYRGFAVALYKIAYEFSKSRSGSFSSSLMGTINSMLFDGKGQDLRTRFALKRMQWSGTASRRNLGGMLAALFKDCEEIQSMDIEEKLDRIYDRTAVVADELFKSFVKGMGEKVAEGDLAGVIKNVSGIIPALFLSVPFFTTINVLNDSRRLLEQLEQRYGLNTWPKRKRVFWFTDTITDLNGVSETIQKIGHLAHRRKLDVTIVDCLTAEEDPGVLPPNSLHLSCIADHTSSVFKTYTLRIPSLLTSLKSICEKEPDEIIVSTPGPVGLIGLVAARLLHIPCIGVYHTDFSAYAREIMDDERVGAFVGDVIRNFYRWCERIYVPSFEYMSILEQRGYERKKMARFRRGIDLDVFTAPADARERMAKQYGIRPGINLLYAGRVSREKNLRLLETVYKNLAARDDKINLIIAGDGPDFEEYHEKLGRYPGVYFLGRLPRKALVTLYGGSDLFLFPSVTDTFGMVVLEAQACGLPALVSEQGGPHEIVMDGKTGHVIPANQPYEWLDRIEKMATMIRSYPEHYLEMRFNSRRMVEKTYDWNNLLNELFGHTYSVNRDNTRLNREHGRVTPVV